MLPVDWYAHSRCTLGMFLASHTDGSNSDARNWREESRAVLA